MKHPSQLNEPLKNGLTDYVALKIIFRPAVDTDLHFILSSYLKSAWEWREDREIRKDDFFKKEEASWRSILSRSGVIIAADADEPDHIYGFIVGERACDELILHYIYVRYVYRNFGVGRELYNAVVKPEEKEPFITYWNKNMEVLSKKYPVAYVPELKTNPYSVPSEPISVL
jgi:GNAT superfamily N-acetyltransferase